MEIIFTKLMLLLWGTLGLTVSSGAYMFFRNTKNKLGTSKLTNSMYPGWESKIGFKIAKDIAISEKKCLENILVVAPPGEGKTTGFILNNLLGSHLFKCSKVIMDVKDQEIYKKTHKYRESLGERNIVLSPLGKGNRINPLDNCKEISDIKSLAITMLSNAVDNDSFDKWSNMALPLITAALMYCKKKQFPFNTISHAVRMITLNDPSNLRKLFMETKNIKIIEQWATFEKCLRSEATADSILITLTSKLAIYLDPRIEESLSYSDFELDDTRNIPTNIYIQYELGQIQYIKPVLALLLGQIMDFAISRTISKDELPILFLIDELQNCGKIPSLNGFTNTARHYKCMFVGILQDIASMYAIYGKYETESFLSSMKTKCVLPSISDYEALSYISNLTGETTVPVHDMSTGKTVDIKKKLFEPDEIRRLNNNKKGHGQGKVLIIAGENMVMLKEQDSYYKNQEYVKNREVI